MLAFLFSGSPGQGQGLVEKRAQRILPGGGNCNPLQYFCQNGKRTEEPGRPQSKVCKESDKTERLNMQTCMPGVKSAEMM